MDAGVALLAVTAVMVGSVLVNIALVLLVRDMRKDIARVARAASRASRTAEAEMNALEDLMAELDERRQKTTLPVSS